VYMGSIHESGGGRWSSWPCFTLCDTLHSNIMTDTWSAQLLCQKRIAAVLDLPCCGKSCRLSAGAGYRSGCATLTLARRPDDTGSCPGPLLLTALLLTASASCRAVLSMTRLCPVRGCLLPLPLLPLLREKPMRGPGPGRNALLAGVLLLLSAVGSAGSQAMLAL
jgi:hypothetical protein